MGRTNLLLSMSRALSGWPETPTANLADPDPTANDYFGYNVAVAPGSAIVAAVGTGDFEGTAYLYKS